MRNLSLSKSPPNFSLTVKNRGRYHSELWMQSWGSSSRSGYVLLFFHSPKVFFRSSDPEVSISISPVLVGLKPIVGPYQPFHLPKSEVAAQNAVADLTA